MITRPNLRQLSAELQEGKITAQKLATDALVKAQSSSNVFISVNDSLVQNAMAIDRLREAGESASALAGIPITLKDLFDVKGELTLAGSKALKHVAKPAQEDCPVVGSLRAAGLLFAGRVNMSEFAFSGMGLNPHYGNAQSIWDRETGRLPGGSSSGSAVSVAEGIVCATMGSDTAGSCRIPASFNGIVGVKPSFGRYSLKGVYPLSPTSDAPGPLAVDLDSCYLLDQVLTGRWSGFGDLPEMIEADESNLTLLIPQAIVMQELDVEVKQAFDKAIGYLENAGIKIVSQPLPAIDEAVDMFLTEPVAGFEAYQQHKELLEKYGEDYDPVVFSRMTMNKNLTATQQQQRYERKNAIIQSFDGFMVQNNFDGIIYPTTAGIPPSIEFTEIPENTLKTNLRCLRNTASANYFNGCSISLPIHDYDSAPVGMMVSLGLNQDDKLYQVSEKLESIIQENRR